MACLDQLRTAPTLVSSAQGAQFITPMHPKGSVEALSYGTAGFRTDASLLDHVMFRMGIVSSYFSKICGGSAFGVMVTASHNPEKDNGVKIVEPGGDMLRSEWEPICERVANCADNELATTLNELFPDVDIAMPSTVFVGRDTRPSSPNLVLAAIDGASVISHSSIRSVGVCTTPQLHYCVAVHNSKMLGVPSLEGYCDKFAKAFNALVGEGAPFAKLTVDCANGVGAKLIDQARHAIHRIKVSTINDGTHGKLNEGCGADFVKSNQTPPANFSGENRCAVFDGDADRIVYCYLENGKFRLLDGDRIATLFAKYFGSLLDRSNLKQVLTVGIVQTAYANGAAREFAEKILGTENVYCTPTGVKHLHHKAQELDIGIYFEANGHGTVTFGPKVDPAIASAMKTADSNVATAATELGQFRNLINDTVGDAWTDLLAVEAILFKLNLTTEQWFNQYTDLPNRLQKVKVPDRTMVTTTDAERTCVTPNGLQEAINDCVAKVPKGRAFIRPSGTEDVVRVYAEAERDDATEQLASEVSALVTKFCGGQ